MNFFKTLSSRNLNLLLAGLVVALAVMLGLAVWLTPAPKLLIEYDGATVEVFADKAWSLLPNDCLQIRWAFDGELPIHVDGREWHESGEQQFCPTIFATSPKVEMTDHRKGVYLGYSMDIKYLPDFVVNVLGVAALGFFPLIASYYLWTNDPDKRPALRTIFLAVLALCLCIATLRLTGWPLTIEGVLAILRGLFINRNWQFVGAALVLVLYLSLAVEAAWQGLRHRRVADFVVVGGYFLFIVLLYLPFGFDTMAHWEEWRGIAFLENLYHFNYDTELTGRHWLFIFHTLARVFSSETFCGFNVLCALMLWAKVAFVYGILRQLTVPTLYAFLVTMLFAVYPVDAGLMYLRAIHAQFSVLTFYTALYFLLRYMRKPSRPFLAGTWLSLAISTGTYESSYALIFAIPILWWYLDSRYRWRHINLMAIWYLLPALKIVYMFLLLIKGERFYSSGIFYSSQEAVVDGLVPRTLGNLMQVFHQTFFLGWNDSIVNMGKNGHLFLTLAMLALVGFVAWLLHRSRNGDQAISLGQNIMMLIAGLLFIFPAVGVLIWIDEYSSDLWRLYLYVPLSAAIVVFGLILFLTSLLARDRRRNALIVVVCLLLILPAISRLVSQHEYYVRSAKNKQHVLAQILQFAPELASQTRVLVINTMSLEELRQKRISEMIKSDMIGVALTVLHRGKTSGIAQLCVSVEDCPPLNRWVWRDHLDDIIVFLLNSDLSLELLERPSEFIDAYSDVSYDLTRLYDPNAPWPSRAYTMLGLSNE